jgi:protein-tyrosine phosphatase
MLAKNSYLVIAVIFFCFAIFSQHNNDYITTAIFIWFGMVFCFFWLIHFLKTNFSKDFAPLLVRDSFLKYGVLSLVLFPFLFIKYLSLLFQSFSKEGPISQVTDKIFIGQQLLWFHQKVFKDKNISAVLDVTIENREPFFIVMNKSINYMRIPVLDKTSPSVEQIEKGVRWGLDQVAQGRKLYVHCGAGHERSATFVAAILLRSKRFTTLDEAMDLIKQNRFKARFVGNQEAILKHWFVANEES